MSPRSTREPAAFVRPLALATVGINSRIDTAAKVRTVHRGTSAATNSLLERIPKDEAGNKRQTVEIQVSHVGPDLLFATADVTKSSADGSPATAAAAG